MSREENVAVVEAYLTGLTKKELSGVPFALGVVFEGPRVGRLQGRNSVLGFLKSISPMIQRIEIHQHIVEGEFVATVFDMETPHGVDHVFDRIHIVNGEINAIHSFYYPTVSDPASS